MKRLVQDPLPVVREDVKATASAAQLFACMKDPALRVHGVGREMYIGKTGA